MVITTRTLLWGGLVVALFAWTSIAVLVGFSPPQWWNVLLFLELLFVGVTALAVVLLALVFRVRGREQPARVLRMSVLVGGVVVVLSSLQYLRLLEWTTGVGVVLMALLLEGLFVYRDRRQATERRPAAERSTPTAGPRTRSKARRERKPPSSSSSRPN